MSETGLCERLNKACCIVLCGYAAWAESLPPAIRRPGAPCNFNHRNGDRLLLDLIKDAPTTGLVFPGAGQRAFQFFDAVLMVEGVLTDAVERPVDFAAVGPTQAAVGFIGRADWPVQWVVWSLGDPA